MREIKFRAWDKFNGIYIYSDKFSRLATFFSECEKLVAGENHLILEQSTGLKDKNGKEIYEGDILKSNFGNSLIVWDEKQARFYIKNHMISAWPVKEFPYEIIGNLYQHPELLKGYNVNS